MMDDVDPHIRRFHHQVNADYARLSAGGYADISARRAVAEEVRAPWTAGGPVMAKTEELIVGAGKLRVRIHRPNADPVLPVLLYIHGGGWMLFSIDTHDRLMREYAARVGCAVIGVDYSLSPEVRFPHALDEIVDVVGWVRSDGAAHGLDPERVAIGGDSAGANLSLATALRLRDAGEPPLNALLLNYGAFDTEIRDSHSRYDGDAYNLTASEMVDFWDAYLGPDGDRQSPYARPMLAKLHNLPPAFLCIAACDILADENRAMSAKLRDAGVEVRMTVYAGAIHSFLESMNISDMANTAIADGADWLKRHLKSGASAAD
ncbi:alpha/beta hydrolase fold domain-containing protein [Sphingobium boeckii]|uniref:Acetyl esterase n=1 Tax=Sphingobium boeckii TaxID=1082345 RepID=A0A7W9AJT2_9SPHN|nr:alpha/beta hydrolase fold domain-containing protein [Sphingobium boeckii]MBB5686878.1 acetyl esterase [Sphingobium boeckii]